MPEGPIVVKLLSTHLGHTADGWWRHGPGTAPASVHIVQITEEEMQ
jgi:hypothetical protein